MEKNYCYWLSMMKVLSMPMMKKNIKKKENCFYDQKKERKRL